MKLERIKHKFGFGISVELCRWWGRCCLSFPIIIVEIIRGHFHLLFRCNASVVNVRSDAAAECLQELHSIFFQLNFLVKLLVKLFLTRKRGNCECIATRPPKPRRPLPALITTPCQVWSRWTYPLPYYSVFTADTLLYAVNLTFDRMTLTYDLWPWTFAAYRLWRDETLYQTWTQMSSPRRSYCDFIVWPCDVEHCVTCCARLCDNFHQVWPSTTYTCLNYRLFWRWYVMSRCVLYLWPVDLESSTRYIKCLYELWAKSSNHQLNYW